MSGSTPNFGWSVPDSGDQEAGHTQIKTLGNAIDATLTKGDGKVNAMTASGTINLANGNTVTFAGPASQTLTAPAAVAGIRFELWNIDGADSVTLAAGAGDTINGAASIVVPSGWRAEVVCVALHDLRVSLSPFGLGPATMLLQEFTSSGTYTLPTGAVFVEGVCIGGGGGGYGGTPGVGGGGGGAPGGWVPFRFKASQVPSSVTVTVGNGGQSGVANGGASSFGSLVQADGGANATGTAGAAKTMRTADFGQPTAGAGATSLNTGGGNSSYNANGYPQGPGAGGGGAWATAAGTYVGGAGTNGSAVGGSETSSGTPAYGVPTPTASPGGNYGGAGGCGGAINGGLMTGTPQGGLYGGGGGGGPQASGSNSGGNGGKGIVVVRTFF